MKASTSRMILATAQNTLDTMQESAEFGPVTLFSTQAAALQEAIDLATTLLDKLVRLEKEMAKP